MAELNFDATGVSPAETFEPVPTNWYPYESRTNTQGDQCSA
jgi:hypothetical protein